MQLNHSFSKTIFFSEILEPKINNVPIAKRRYTDEAHLRNLVDSYKEDLAKLDLSLGQTYDLFRPSLCKLKSFRDLEDEDRRRYYYEKALRKKEGMKKEVEAQFHNKM